jgi:hypothetical protein
MGNQQSFAMKSSVWGALVVALALGFPTASWSQAPVAPAPAAPARIQFRETTDTQKRLEEVSGYLREAGKRVERIVNQPVRRIPMGRGMRYTTYQEGWFHAGANKPDFNNVDVRTTQESPYADKPFVTSTVNPGVVFAGPELEFNANLKFFYTDRSVPKKRLTEPEMLEINRLYRIIGQCEAEVARLMAPKANPQAAGGSGVTESPSAGSAPSSPKASKGISPDIGYPIVGVLGVLLVIGILRRFIR